MVKLTISPKTIISTFILIYCLLISNQFVYSTSDHPKDFYFQNEKESQDSTDNPIVNDLHKEDIYNRLMDLMSEESETQNLDEKSSYLAKSFENFNDEVIKIYHEELENLKKNPNDVFKVKNSNLSALEQNKDPVFYNWFSFSLTIQKIILSLTYSLSSKFIEYSDLSLTPKCMLSMLVSLDEVKKQKTWIIKMLDSTGKPGFHNILDGSIISLGGYDQCLSIKSPKLLRSDPGKIYGKYCLVKFDIPLPARPKHIGIKTRLFNFSNTKMQDTAIDDFSSFAHALYEHKPRFGFCIPSQCNQNDLQIILDLYFKNSTMKSHVDYCYSKKDYPNSNNILSKIGIPIEEMSDLQKLILMIYSVIVMFVIVGTAIDLWFNSMEQKEMIKINKLSEHNLKTISNWNSRNQNHHKSFDHSLSRYLVTPSLPTPNLTAPLTTPSLPTPSTAGNYTDESPFFNNDVYIDKKSFEMKNLDAEARRRLFRSTHTTLSTTTGFIPTTPTTEELAKFTVPDSFKLFNYWRISKKNKLLRTFIAFSLYTNGRKLFRTTTNKNDDLDSLNGIRVISMLWIVLTHTYLLPIKSTMVYSRKFLAVSESYLFQFIVNGWVLVDSFFFIGALLLTFNQLRTLNRTNGKINLFRIIFARLVRISPCLWFAISLIFVLPVFVKGPLVNDYFTHEIQHCRKGWLLNVLFINNWFPLHKICMLHTWYLSADFQMFIFTSLIVIIIYKWPKIGCLITITTIILSMIGTFLFTYLNNHPPTVVFNTPMDRETLETAAEIYTVTFPHIAPYCLGILAGFVLFKGRTYKINSYLVFFSWVTMISLAFTILMWTQRWNRGEPWTPISSAMYASFHRILWALVLFWITFACSTDHGGFIDSFLSWNFFKFLSKLSFPCFLIHFLVIWGRLSYARNILGFSHYTMVCEYIVNVIFSLLASLILYLCIELPSINLYNVYFLRSFECFTVKINKKKSLGNESVRNHSSFWFS